MVTIERDGSLNFRVYLPHAQSVDLLTSYADWEKGRLPLEREPATDDARPEDVLPGGHTGWWCVKTHAPEGEHAFSYLVDDQWWLPDYAAHGVRRNEYGNWTSLLFVPQPTRLVARAEKQRAALAADRPSSRYDSPRHESPATARDENPKIDAKEQAAMDA
jgi:1,4-alpha-glucan branching enzyme